MNRAIAWFVGNPVAANLFMLVLVVGGGLTLSGMQREEFPTIETDLVRVSVVHLGATPEEVEEAVCVRIEEVIQGVQDVDRIETLAVEGACNVTVELVIGSDAERAYDEIKNRVDGIDTFPIEAEKPVVARVVQRADVIFIAIAGDMDERGLKALGQQLRDEVAALPGVSQVDLEYTLPYEISIEVSEETLRRHGLSLAEVADVVRHSSLDVPGGSVRTHGGEILLRTKGQAYRGEEFESIIVLTHEDGTAITLGEIGRVVDGFAQADLYARFDGKPAVVIKVYRAGDEDILGIASEVFAWIDDAQRRVPEGVTITPYSDESAELTARLGALSGNARSGMILVLIVLGLFLRFRLAMWVAAGVPIAVLGAISLFPTFGLTLNTLSVMAFILVLGILVDDAIVVGESVYTHEQRIADPRRAAIEGTWSVHVPVVFGVLTTVAAFMPLGMVPGRLGRMFMNLAMAAILCLFFSLLESQLILPAHLAHRRRERSESGAASVSGLWTRAQEVLAGGLERFASETYGSALRRVIEWRYTAVAVAIGILILAGAMLDSGRLRYQFFPSIDGDHIRATLTLPPGTPVALTEVAVARLEQAAEQVAAEVEAELEADGKSGAALRFMLSVVGVHQDFQGGGGDRDVVAGGSHLAEVYLELAPIEERGAASGAMAQRWRELTGPIPDALELNFSSVAFGAGDAIAIQLAGGDIDTLAAAAADVRRALSQYPGVFDVSDSFRGGKQEVVLALRPDARPLGLALDDLGRQVRQAFYGEEVQRIQRGRDDVKVMVRYPESERRSLSDLEDMRIRGQDGTEVPFASVAEATFGRGFSTIRRTDRERVVLVSADVDRAIATPEEVFAHLVAQMPAILAPHSGVRFGLEGEQRESGIAFAGLIRGMVLALLVVYALLAIPLKSYSQPLIIMSVIPFGTVGAAVGHLVMGWPLVFFSVLGIVALAGVVVNGSLVLVHFVNQRREAGGDLVTAVVEGGIARFRPIFLTSLTTFIGLLPLMFESDIAAFMVIPMAISLAFGVVFSSVVTLLLVPCLYAILADVEGLTQRRASKLGAPLSGAAAQQP